MLYCKGYANISIMNLTIFRGNYLIDNEFDQVDKFIKEFGTNSKSKSYDFKISIKRGKENNIILSEDLKELTITGPKLDDLSDPYVYIGLVQAITRFISLHSIKKGILLAHGSVASIDGNGILFGDDGASVGKTLSSLVLGLNSGEYVVDEFPFYDVTTGKSFGIGKIPIHIRSEVKETLEKGKLLSEIHSSNLAEVDAGYFKFNLEKMKIIGEIKTPIFCFVYFGDTNKIIELIDAEKVEALSYCFTAHTAKLLNPNLDRMSFIDRVDSSNFKEFDIAERDRIIRMLDMKDLIENASKSIKCYKLIVKDPLNIYDLVKDL